MNLATYLFGSGSWCVLFSCQYSYVFSCPNSHGLFPAWCFIFVTLVYLCINNMRLGHEVSMVVPATLFLFSVLASPYAVSVSFMTSCYLVRRLFPTLTSVSILSSEQRCAFCVLLYTLSYALELMDGKSHYLNMITVRIFCTMKCFTY